MTFRFLGTGSSGGVPRINGDWGACDPSNPKNRRTRCSVLVSRWAGGVQNPTRVLVDTSPDMREQLLLAQIAHLDAILLTHDHADQTHGIDDLRIFAYTARRRLPVHMDETTYGTIGKRFHYCFEGRGAYPSILAPHIDLGPGEKLCINGPGGSIDVLALEQDHGGGQHSLGFRFGSIAYCNDTVGLPEETFEGLSGVDTLIVDALRYEPHPTHAHLDMALEWIERVKPREAYLTNLHIDMDYDELSARLPMGVRPAFDGLELTQPL